MWWRCCKLWAGDGDEGCQGISGARNEKRRRALERGDQGDQYARDDEGKISPRMKGEDNNDTACFGELHGQQ